MRKLLTISLVSALMMTSCSQSDTHVPFYQYGTGSGGGTGSSLGMHTLRKGETLWSVAKAYNVDLRDMLDMNRFAAPFRTQAGQRIRIPAPANYKVRKGDTLYKVSRMFETTTTDIARLNQIKAPYKLAVGQSLRLPPKHSRPQQMIQMQAIMRTAAPATRPVGTAPVANGGSARIEREELQPIVSTVPAAPSEKTASPQYTPQPAVVQSSPEIVMPQLDPNGRVNFIKPVGGQIISRYGPKADGLHNDGINIKANKGDMVRAAEKGVVVYQGNQIEGYGNMILVRHAGGYLTAYAHLQKALVKKGEAVKRGQTIGTVGTTGNVSVPQLHFEIRKGRNAIDPATLLKL